MAKMAHLVDPDWVDLTEIELYNKKSRNHYCLGFNLKR